MSYTYKGGSKDCLYQSALFEGDKLLGSILCNQRRTHINLVPSPVTDIETAKFLFGKFKSKNIVITDVIAEKKTAYLYRELIHAQGSKTKTFMTQGIYKCTNVIMPEHSSDIRFRAARLEDVNTIGEWIQAFSKEAVPHDSPIDGLKLAKVKIEKETIYVIEKDNQLISMAGWSRDIETSCTLLLVYTPKSLRKNGYASLVTAKLTDYLLGSGKRETNLYTDMTNPTSNKIYVNVGYEFVCDSTHLGII